MADNIEGAEIWGIEYKSEYKFTPEIGGFSVITSAAYQKGTDKTNNEDLSNIDPFKIVTGLRYISSDERVTSELIGTFVGKGTKANSSYDPASYYTVDLLTKYKYSDRLAFSLGVNNLFNEKYYQYQNLPYSSVSADKLKQYREAGTNIQAQFKFTF